MTTTTVKQKNSVRSQILFWSALIAVFFYFVSLIHGILLPFVMGILAAYFLDPAATRLLAALKCSRSVAAAIITIAFFVIVILLCILLVPLISHQLFNLLHDLPTYISNLQVDYGYTIDDFVSRLNPEQTGAIKEAMSHFSGTLAGLLGRIASDILRSGRELLDILSLFFITPIVVFYLLRDWDKLVAKFRDLLPRKHKKVILEQLQAIDKTLSDFIRGQTNVCLIMASYYSLMLYLAGVNFAVGLGIMTGCLLFIPFVGFATCFALTMLVALFQFGLHPHLLFPAAVYLTGMTLEGSILTPRLVGHEVNLHPVWIIFGMLSGATLFGLVGVLISVPVTSVIGVLARFATEQYTKSAIYLNK
jgi:predicted PurR-regulated permease PerM